MEALIPAAPMKRFQPSVPERSKEPGGSWTRDAEWRWSSGGKSLASANGPRSR